MVALPDVPSVAKTNVVYNYGGRNMHNVLHIQKTTGSTMTNTELNTLAAGVYAAWAAHILPLQANGCGLTEVICAQLLALGGGFGAASGSSAGGDNGIGNSTNATAACVSWIERAHYRGGHPRSYIGGLKSTTQLNTYQFTATFVTGLETGCNAFLTAITAIDSPGKWQLVCVHYRGRMVVVPGTPFVNPITGAIMDQRIDTQRRRLGKP